MNDRSDSDAISKAEQWWQENLLKPRVDRFKLDQSPRKFYSPNALKNFDFLTKVGFPGQYPFTAGNSPLERWRAHAEAAAQSTGGVPYAQSSGRYSGYGTCEDYRDYQLEEQSRGSRAGPNIAFDLVTQCGYDSDHDYAAGEVGRVGVAVDSLRDFKVIYEAFTGELELDRIASNFTINAPCVVILAMYAALAEQRGIPLERLRGTPQNDILKEFIARGTYIYPPRQSMRLFRDSLVFCRQNMPKMNVNSIGGYHMREGGATRIQDLAFSLANGIAYVQAGVDAGLEPNEFTQAFTFNSFGGSMQIYHEIAFHRAARRMWARILKEQFGVSNPRGLMVRLPLTAQIGCVSTTLQRSLNNLSRSVIGGVAAGMSGGMPSAYPPFDEPLGLGHSLEAQQLQRDATRIMLYEAGLGDVSDPWAGSYFMESLTDETEAEAQEELDTIASMGGAVAAIESGYMPRAIGRSAYERQRRIERREDFIVGVNCFTSEQEMDVEIVFGEQETYDRSHMATAESRQLERLATLKRERSNDAVDRSLSRLRSVAATESANLMPTIIQCVKAEATLQEICDAMRDVFGEADPVKV